MTKVLVTGASGFVGHHLSQALVARGDDVTCLVRKSSNVERLKPLGVTLAYGDVTDPSSLAPAVAGKAVVYHLAGRIKSLRRQQFYEVNEEGCRNVAQACAAQSSPPVLVSVSSLAAAGATSNSHLRVETDAPHPVSDYGRSKRAGELAIEPFADRVPITIVRPPIVVGEGDLPTLALFKMVKRMGVHLAVGWRSHRFSLIHAADLASLLILAAERGERLAPPSPADDQAVHAQGYYFAACDEHPTYGELGKKIGEAMGRRFTLVIRFGPGMAWVVAAVSEAVAQMLRVPFTFRLDKFREAIAGSWTCSPQKAFDQLGFRVETPLLDRLRQTYEWYCREKWL